MTKQLFSLLLPVLTQSYKCRISVHCGENREKICLTWQINPTTGQVWVSVVDAGPELTHSWAGDFLSIDLWWQFWSSICDAGAPSNQHCLNVAYLLGSNVKGQVELARLSPTICLISQADLSNHDTLSQCCYNAGPTLHTMKRHCASVVSACGVSGISLCCLHGGKNVVSILV